LASEEGLIKLKTLKNHNIALPNISSILQDSKLSAQKNFCNLFNQLFLQVTKTQYVQSFYLRSLLVIFEFKQISSILNGTQKYAPQQLAALIGMIFYQDDSGNIDSELKQQAWLVKLKEELGTKCSISAILNGAGKCATVALRDFRDRVMIQQGNEWQMQIWFTQMKIALGNNCSLSGALRSTGKNIKVVLSEMKTKLMQQNPDGSWQLQEWFAPLKSTLGEHFYLSSTLHGAGKHVIKTLLILRDILMIQREGQWVAQS